MLCKAALLAASVVSLSSLSGAAVIVPGATWVDTSGNVIQAHGGGILKVGSTWYWHGEDKAHNGGTFRAVSCYSSPDLTTWTRHNDALTPVAGGNISTNNLVERPKVIYNKANSEYVMWFHSDSSNYGAAQVGVATAKTPCGPFSYRGSFRPLGAESRDMGIYQDDDAAQTAYLLYASDNNQNFKISRLDANYYSVVTQVSVISSKRAQYFNLATLDKRATIPSESTFESPGIIKRNGACKVFHLPESHPNKRARSIIFLHLIRPAGTPIQTSLFLVPGLQNKTSHLALRARTFPRTYNLLLNQNTAIYMGDRWRPNLLGSSRYIWYPLVWGSNNLPTIVASDVWSVNLDNGVTTAAAGTTYEAEKGSLSGNARLLNNTGFSGGVAVGYIGNGGSVTITNVQGIGADQWISLYYANADSGWRNTTISVNGGTAVRVDQPNTGGGGVVLSVPVKLNLRSGTNTITIGAGQSNYAADLDKIIVSKLIYLVGFGRVVMTTPCQAPRWVEDHVLIIVDAKECQMEALSDTRPAEELLDRSSALAVTLLWTGHQ
ncbi:hypothetical protein D9611_003438 [Ephemerocybe angulata]|uniref:CBM6 domain-containing protein n=1 Tax=Ephemerocybe angulata TaxID=980116 RepID=A0A8H5C915_9AGAR|nr:hypothetical protein D9611_003438 [Tulosesus angulatus]